MHFESEQVGVEERTTALDDMCIERSAWYSQWIQFTQARERGSSTVFREKRSAAAMSFHII